MRYLKYFYIFLLTMSTPFIYGGDSQRDFMEGDCNLYQWAVLGAGPAGIAVVGNLLDHQERSVIWIDSDFSAGSLGKWYATVPSNSLVETFLDYFYSCQSFKFKEYAHQFELTSMDPQSECFLDAVIQPLKWCTAQLRSQVNSMQEYCLEIEKLKDCWILTFASGKKIYAVNLVLAIGGRPKSLDFSLPQDCEIIPLEIALDLSKLRSLIHPSDTVAVFGVSHSGMLTIKNLCDCNVKQIISFAKRPLRYAIPINNTYIHNNTGLKGVVARWTKEVYENNPPAHLIKAISNQENINQLITSDTKVIIAIGFEGNEIKIKGFGKSLFDYDPSNGKIDDHLFGIGIAFPEKIVDLSGEAEWNVGLIKFMKYAKRIVPNWIWDANHSP